MLEVLIVALLLFWVLSYAFIGVTSSLIHLLLVVAVVLLVIRLLNREPLP